MVESGPEIRYSRHFMKGWDQKKLSRMSVFIVGAGGLGSMAALSLACMGVGRIYIYDPGDVTDNSGAKFLYRGMKGKCKAEALAYKLGQINPLVEYRPSGIKFNEKISDSFPRACNAILDCTHSYEAIPSLVKIAEKKKIPLVTARTDGLKGEVDILPRSGYTPQKEKRKQSPPALTFAIAGIAADEVRRCIMPLSEVTPDLPIKYQGSSWEPPKSKVTMVGAGGLGNFLGLGIACNPGYTELEIIDFDVIETSNLNRQFLFWDSVGKKKAETLARKLSEINPNLKVSYKDKKINSGDDLEGAAVLCDCLDNVPSRRILSDYAFKHGKLLVSGGVDSTECTEGQVAVYIPNQTWCISHQLSLPKEGSNPCLDPSNLNHFPSTISPNLIIGMIMTEQLGKLQNPHPGMVEYISKGQERVSYSTFKGKCDCG